MVALIEPYDFMEAVANRLRDVPEFMDNVFFPNPDRVETSPCVMLLGGAQPLGPSRFEWTLKRPIWILNYTIRLAVDTQRASEAEQSLLWKHLPKVIDALDPAAYDGSANAILPTLNAQVGHNTPKMFLDGTVAYASAQKLYVIDIYYEAKFHRTANTIPIGG